MAAPGFYTGQGGPSLLDPFRFIWNATRGYRLRPWKSPYLRWRIETYSGQHAESLRAASVLGWLWATRWELLEFLRWTGSMQREARKRS